MPTAIPTVRWVLTPLPSESPSLASSVPSHFSSVRLIPSAESSVVPTRSAFPSAEPSVVPTGSTSPSDVPSLAPFLSAFPFADPSDLPTGSTSPSDVSSLDPSISAFPSAEPSDVPTGSTSPSDLPSLAPSVNAYPAAEPSEIPSGTTTPSNTPSYSDEIIDTRRISIIISPTNSEGDGGADECEVTERHFLDDESCSKGDFGPENIDVTISDDATVSFKLTQPFTADRFAVWVDNPEQHDSADHFCWFSNNFTRYDSHDFTAKCTSGYARVSVYGGLSTESSFQQIGVEEHVPLQNCQSDFAEAIFPEFNPQKRCYWEFTVPCGCEEHKRTKEIAEEPAILAPEQHKDFHDARLDHTINPVEPDPVKRDLNDVEPELVKAMEPDLEVTEPTTLEPTKPSDTKKERKTNFLAGFLHNARLERTINPIEPDPVKRDLNDVEPEPEVIKPTAHEPIKPFSSSSLRARDTKHGKHVGR